MTSKKSNSGEMVETLAREWKKCKISEAGICSLVGDRLLQSRAIIQQRSAEGEDRPYEGTNEIVLFRAFVERALAIPTQDLFRDLLHYWKIQLYHLSPNSILHLFIFTHLCEAFLGSEPHFNLFHYLFLLCPYPSKSKIVEIGGAVISLRPRKETGIHCLSAHRSKCRMEKFLVLCW